MEQRIIECVPNFSEGRDKEIIKCITDAIESVGAEVALLDVDPGEATNRTVVTFAGTPEAVVEAAFRGISKAAELIDMSKHHGAHPRMGATDVCPLVPVSGVSLEECAELARALAERVATELHIPVYAYESAAFRPERKNLAVCRRGEYEGLSERLGGEDGADFGDRPFDEAAARTGATAIGSRDFLIAVNFNLNTTSTRRANAIAFDVREKGRQLREGGKLTGKPLFDENGKPLMQPGTLKGTKAIGWYIDEYGIAQVSMNITDAAATPLHRAFDEVCRRADARGVRVTGTEIVGLVPRKALLDAADWFLTRQQRSLGIPDSEKIRLAVRSMGLDELKPFEPAEKVIEDVLAARRPQAPRLVDLTARKFAETTASESPAPGGGSVAAYMGALAAALGTMVANLSAHKAGWDDRWEEFSDMAVQGQALMERLLQLVDRDTEAFNACMAAYGMPKGSDAERMRRDEAIRTALVGSVRIPYSTLCETMAIFPLLKQVALQGNPACASDAGVGALAARAAVHGAVLNMRINAGDIKPADASVTEMLAEAADMQRRADAAEAEILGIVNNKIAAV
ncbi:MAG: glutamate formimidoyltransferase [Muribaculaceae bacterium]|nr:glutamate formimidoyltransferase [Muribaculaceae bacterium]